MLSMDDAAGTRPHPLILEDDALAIHRRELATLGRCPFCAELIGPWPVLRGRPCPRCRRRLGNAAGSPEELIRRLRGQWGKWRRVAFPLLVVATGLAGVVPLLGGAVRMVGMVVLHVAFVRRPLRWLSARRRLAARVTLRLALAFLVLLGLLVDALAAPFFGANVLVSGVVSLVVGVAYAEGALAYLCGRMWAEARGEPLVFWEWALPAGLLVVVLGVTAGLVAVLAGVITLVTSMPQLMELWGGGPG